MKQLKSLAIGILLLLGMGVLGACSKGESNLPEVTVFKTSTCSCCVKWVRHLEANGFTVKMTNMPDVTPMKDQYGVPTNLRSCHTAVVGGYVVEGHVPAEDIIKLLGEDLDVAGLAVGGMPMGSPGMEGARKDAYEVTAFKKNGEQSVFAHR